MALNFEGNSNRTPIRKTLMAQTGIRSHQIGKAMRTVKAGAGRLQDMIEAQAGETNASIFGRKVQRQKESDITARRCLKLQRGYRYHSGTSAERAPGAF